MKGCKQKTKVIRKFILDNVGQHPTDIVKVVAQKFSISRQAAARHLKALVKQGDIEIEGNTSGRTYRASKGRIVEFQYTTSDGIVGQSVWTGDILPLLQSLPESVIDLWESCFLEIFTNAITYSDAKKLKVRLIRQKAQTTITITDDGIGIFRHIQKKSGLDDNEQAALKLSGNRFVIDPSGTGKGHIFLASRLTDHFTIYSERMILARHPDIDWDWTLDQSDEEVQGTMVCMIIDNDNPRTRSEVVNEIKAAHPLNHKPARTCIPVRLVNYSSGVLFSRSQARRILGRVARVKVAVLDFFGIKEIGPAFADQVFRVFSTEHPDIQLLYTNANRQIEEVIKAARDYATGAA